VKADKQCVSPTRFVYLYERFFIFVLTNQKVLMIQLTVNIPEAELGFYMQLFRQLGIETSDSFIIPEEHKEVVRQRQKNIEQDPAKLLQWEEIQNHFILD
jgi:hypothetical protein